MSMENNYYTYAYLTFNRRPYYIGMGCGNRAYMPHPHLDVCMPDRDMIIILKDNLTQDEAWRHEEYLIAVIDGLVNKTKGGRGWGGGCPATPARKRKIGDANRGRSLSAEHKRKLSLAKLGKKATPQAIASRVAGIQRSITLRSPEGDVIAFNSINECAKYLGVDQSSVSHLRRGKTHSCKGFTLN